MVPLGGKIVRGRALSLSMFLWYLTEIVESSNYTSDGRRSLGVVSQENGPWLVSYQKYI